MTFFITNNWKKIFFPLIAILLFADFVYSSRDNPHKVLEDPSQCIRCHKEKPNRLPTEFSDLEKPPIKDGVTGFCTTCHGYGERSHPTDILVDFPIPLDMPLKNKRITCYTCHNPHGEWESDNEYISVSFLDSLFSDKRKHKTYFLRRTNKNGELCIVCHK